MAYEKQTWACGETITADKLNHMEDGIAEASGGGTAGYECKEEYTLLTDASVTTVAGEDGNVVDLAYSTPITADTIRVTFNGVEYSCDKATPVLDVTTYGGMEGTAPDFSNYPFGILSTPIGSVLFTETAGTYQVKIETFEKTVETSECFNMARGYSCIDNTVLLTNETITSVKFGN